MLVVGIYAVRLAVIDDQVRPGELHLLRLVPVSWLSAESQTVFENIPTGYGPVTLRFRLGHDGKRLDVSLTTRFRRQPDKVLLHVPPLPGLEGVNVDGRKHAAQPGGVLTLE